jgi:hypothetical protein
VGIVPELLDTRIYETSLERGHNGEVDHSERNRNDEQEREAQAGADTAEEAAHAFRKR